MIDIISLFLLIALIVVTATFTVIAIGKTVQARRTCLEHGYPDYTHVGFDFYCIATDTAVSVESLE